MIRELRWPLGKFRARPLDPATVQGDILQPYGLLVSRHLFVRVAGPESGRNVLADALPRITSGARWAEKPAATLNVALSHEGLAAIGAPAALLASFPQAFREGMAARAATLGDTGRSAPGEWDVGLGTDEAHILFTVNAAGDDECAAAVAELTASFERQGATVVCEQRGRRLPDRKEHFGYTDGVGQPSLVGAGGPARGEGALGTFKHWHGVPVGEMFHGHPDEDGYPSPGPADPFGTGGAYKVWRKLHEDVPTFRRWIAEQAATLDMDEELLKAKLIGRWPDASPLALTPDEPDPEIAADPDRVNDFDYVDDPDGLRCPLGAHIRRTNPRSGLGFGDALSARQRIIRRGMTYGTALPAETTDDDGIDRGIYFVAYMADIERQFEFIQADWCNDGDTVNVGHDRDPFIGRAPGDHKFSIPGEQPKFVHPLAELVVTKGGEYLWAPSMDALGRLADGSWGAAARPPGRGPLEAIRRAAGTVLGVLLAPIAWLVSFARAGRAVHTKGAAFDAELAIEGSDDPLLADTLLASPATISVTARLSRGYGRPLSKPDVHGLAVRIPVGSDDGARQDLLMASAKRSAKGGDRTDTTMGYGPLLSSTLRVATTKGQIVVRAVPAQEMPDDATIHAGDAAGLAFEISVAAPGTDGDRVALLTLGEAIPPNEAEALTFTVGHDAGGISPVGLFNAARLIVYPCGQAGRRLRTRLGRN
ncbi:MAG: Dyp-type peroxidase [Acidimicrobiia bacterium]|nr:Dyp-type peroxidase [Acidimicrobiia bacterium]